MKKKTRAVSDNASHRMQRELKAHDKERFQAGYATGLSMLERGEIKGPAVRRAGEYDQYGPGFDDEDLSDLAMFYQVVTGEKDEPKDVKRGSVIYCTSTAFEYFAKRFGGAPELPFRRGIVRAILDAWKDIQGSKNDKNGTG